MDWLLLLTLVVPVALYINGTMTYPIERWRMTLFFSATFALFVALISPLDAASEALFSAHMIQHLLLMLVAAPLLVWSRPLAPLLRGLPRLWARPLGKVVQVGHHPTLQAVTINLSAPLAVLLLHVVALWLWHLPALYNAALISKAVHILEHATFFLSAALFWWMIVNRDQLGARVLPIFIVMMASGLLGALMTFSGTPWYAGHAPFTNAWGLTPLEDQQLAGLLMWVPAGILYAAVAATLLARWLDSLDERSMKRKRLLGPELGAELGKELNKGLGDA